MPATTPPRPWRPAAHRMPPTPPSAAAASPSDRRAGTPLRSCRATCAPAPPPPPRGVVGRLGAPVAERAPESVSGKVSALHPPQQHQQRHARQRLALLATGETNALGSGLVASFATSRSASSAPSDSGTRCSRPAFMRSAGTIQVAACMSNSDHRAPITSPVRAAVRIANRSASAETPSSLASAAVNAPTSCQGSAE